jgi:hypothetical protein
MPVTSAGQLQRRFDKMRIQIPRSMEDMVRRVGDITKKTYQSENSLKFPRRKPVRWGGTVTILTGGDKPQGKFRPTPTGLSQLVEGGSNASGWFEGSKHAGGSRKGREKRFLQGGATGGGRRAVLNIPGIGFRRFVIHPKIGPIDHPLARTAQRLPADSQPAAQQAIFDPMAKRFQGG